MTIIKFLFCFTFSSAEKQNTPREEACGALIRAFGNDTSLEGPQCSSLQVPHAESISGGYCLASLTAAGYYRAGAVNPVSELLQELSGSMGGTPVLTGSNSGGTMFVVRYFAFRDVPVSNKWTFPCYLLGSTYRHPCFFHGNFGVISEECYSETQSIVGAATGMVYGELIMSNGGPLGIVASYSSVYFSFLSNLPIAASNTGFVAFWRVHAHWNQQMQTSSNWVAALTEVNPTESSAGQSGYNYGFDSYLSRGMSTTTGNSEWYGNMSVYSVASISANTLSGISMIPFSFAGKEWDNSDDPSGVGASFKIMGLILSFIMLKKLIAQHTILVTTSAPNCATSCPILDGGFTDNGPITPILAAAGSMAENIRPSHISLLGPSNTMESIRYLLGTGPLSIWTGSGLNLCPFTQVSICRMITTMRKLIVPQLPSDAAQQYRAIGSQYSVFRPTQQAIKPHCEDPLIFDHFSSMCKGDSICHMIVSAISAGGTDIPLSMSNHLFQLSMIWLAPTQIAARFVTQYVPEEVRAMQYYADMSIWFPDFVAVAPQKGGVGFTKVAGHSLLDYITYLVMRLIKSQVFIRRKAWDLAQGNRPLCGYKVYEDSQESSQHLPQ